MSAQHCPSCDRVLYNRRLTKCGFCGADIPIEQRFTPEEEAKLDREMEDLKARSEKREAEREAERKQAAEQAATIQDSS
ncbi:MAG: hypothetical protein ACPGVU_15820, partial [Limisphaerales bacterium]